MKNVIINKKIVEDMKDIILIVISFFIYYCCVMYYRFLDIFSIIWKQVNDDFRDKCLLVVVMIDLVLLFFVSFVEVERGFFLMKIIKIDWRIRFIDDSVLDLMIIKFDFLDVKDFDF